MSSEFIDVSPGVVRSNEGFSVTTKIGGGVIYEDATGIFHVDSEWGTTGVILYRPSPLNRGTAKLSEDEIFSRIIRALKYQGNVVAIM